MRYLQFSSGLNSNNQISRMQAPLTLTPFSSTFWRLFLISAVWLVEALLVLLASGATADLLARCEATPVEHRLSTGNKLDRRHIRRIQDMAAQQVGNPTL